MSTDRLVSTLSRLGADLVLPPLRHGQRPGPVRLLDTAPLPGGLLVLVDLADGGRVLAPMVDGPQGWRRAIPGDGLSAQLLMALAPLQVRGSAPVVLPGIERGLSVDQTNDSVVVGERVLVKWQVEVGDAPAVAPAVLAHLSEVGFTATTGAVASVWWGETLVAQALNFLPGAQDGWDWLPAELLAADTPLPVSSPHSVGELLGAFHSAVSTPSSLWPQPIVVARTLAPLAQYFAGLLAATDELDDEMRGALAPWRERLAAALETVSTARDVRSVRIHADAHVGQVLRWSGGLALGDFDGNPLLPAENRVDPGPTAYDVATMVRSLDHAAWVAGRRAPEHAERLRSWSAAARVSFLEGYALTAPPGMLDLDLLAAFETLSVLHEAVYAARYLPRWRYVPLAVLRAGLGSGVARYDR